MAECILHSAIFTLKELGKRTSLSLSLLLGGFDNSPLTFHFANGKNL